MFLSELYQFTLYSESGEIGSYHNNESL